MSSKNARMVVVGGSIAGLRAAEAARENGFDGVITIVAEETGGPYERPALSKQCLIEGVQAPALRDADGMKQFEWVFGEPASGLNTELKELTVGSSKVSYDVLVIATGSKPRLLPNLPEADGIVKLRDAEDVTQLRSMLTPGARLTIVGAGIIGAEIATAARELGNEVTIIEATEYPLERALGRHLGLLLSGWHAENEVSLRCGVSIAEIGTSGGKVKSVTLSDGTVVPTDVLLISIGVVPATDWLAGSGVELAADGSVLCDEYLQTSVPGVFAAGDVASWPNATTGRTGRLETWTSANEQGAIAGRNAVAHGQELRKYETVPYFWSDWYGQRIQFVGKATEQAPEIVLGTSSAKRFVGLFEEDGRVVGAIAVNEPTKIMKDRRRIAQGMQWDEVIDIYQELRIASAMVEGR